MKNSFVLCLLLVGACAPAVPAQTSADQDRNQEVGIKSRPEPEEPKEIIEAGVKATVVLTAVFRSSGKVTDIKLVKVTPESLPRELAKTLTKRCVKAAKQIKFTPAMKDGRPVSQLIQLNFNFGPD